MAYQDDDFEDPYAGLDLSKPAHADIEVWSRSGVVQGKEWLAANDRHDCELCKSLNGTAYGLRESFFIDQDVQAPPLHDGCRCTLLSVRQLAIG